MLHLMWVCLFIFFWKKIETNKKNYWNEMLLLDSMGDIIIVRCALINSRVYLLQSKSYLWNNKQFDLKIMNNSRGIMQEIQIIFIIHFIVLWRFFSLDFLLQFISFRWFVNQTIYWNEDILSIPFWLHMTFQVF